MPISNIVCLIAIFPFTDDICYMSDVKDIVGLEESHAILEAQALTMLNLLKDIIYGRRS